MAASSSNREAARAFFGTKKPWSVQKDLILANYLGAYLKKMGHHMFSQRRWSEPEPPFLIVDAFAGMGRFKDGSFGSPLHIVEAADEVQKGQYRLVLANEDPVQHETVRELMDGRDHVRSVNMTAENVLTKTARDVGSRALFVFIDPFGIGGYPFDTIAPLIDRNRQGYSTEFLINFAVKDFHKKSARNSVRDRGIENLDANTAAKIDNLDVALGGPWWREFQYDPDLSTSDRTQLVIAGYVERLKTAGFEFIGHCPVRESDEAAPSYRLIHGSRHIEALKLMNNTMGTVIADQLHKRNVEDKAPLFADQIGDADFLAWERGLAEARVDLRRIVPELVADQPGRTRDEVYGELVRRHFLQFLRKEYRHAVKDLVSSGVLRFESSTGNLNMDAHLYPGAGPGAP